MSSVDCLGMLKNTAGRTQRRISLISLVISVKKGYFNPEMYNKYHEGQSLRELYLRRAEETRKWSLMKLGLEGKFTKGKCILQGGFTLGREGNIWVPMGSLKFPYPFYLVPKGLGDLSVILSGFLCNSKLQIPTISLYKRKGTYVTLG